MVAGDTTGIKRNENSKISAMYISPLTTPGIDDNNNKELAQREAVLTVN